MSKGKVVESLGDKIIIESEGKKVEVAPPKEREVKAGESVTIKDGKILERINS